MESDVLLLYFEMNNVIYRPNKRCKPVEFLSPVSLNKVKNKTPIANQIKLKMCKNTEKYSDTSSCWAVLFFIESDVQY